MNTLLCVDVYKMGHMLQYPEDTTEIYSYMEARKPGEIVFFGLQYLLIEYLTKPITVSNAEEFIKYYEMILGSAPSSVRSNVYKLADLGYWPVEIKAIPEGTVINNGNALLTIRNTLPEFAWCVGFLESFLLKLWNPCTVAACSRKYRQLVSRYAALTCDDTSHLPFAVHDFGYRGVSSEETAAISGGAHLLNFLGSDTVPAVSWLDKYYLNNGGGPIALSVPACYEEGTSILTPEGFKLFKDITDKDFVGQVDSNGTVSFVNPKAVINSIYSGEMIRFKNSLGHIDIAVTPNHRMTVLTKRGVEERNASAASVYTDKNSVVMSCTKESDRRLTDIERFKIAFQADGSYVSHIQDYTGGHLGILPVRFATLKKQRKINRIKEILNSCNFEYRESIYKTGSHFWIKPTEAMSKEFNWIHLDTVGTIWAREFIEELTYWDGQRTHTGVGFRFDTTNKNVMDKVQAVVAIAGYRQKLKTYVDKRGNRLPVYSLSIHPTQSLCGQSVKRTNEIYSGRVYCVTVPSGRVVVRSKTGSVFVSGNSEHSVMCSYGRENEDVALDRMLDRYPEGIVSIVSDTYNLWRVLTEWLPSRKDKILARPGKVVLRPDSGNPVDIICGTQRHQKEQSPTIPVPGYLGCLDLLDKVFGHTVNSKGYKVLNPQVGLIYGDGMYYDRFVEMLQTMREQGWASSNLVIGVGGLLLQQHSRDEFGFAIKATRIKRGDIETEIYKDPVTDPGKKSKKGLMMVDERTDGTFITFDQVSESTEKLGALQTVFKDGRITKFFHLEDIRSRCQVQ